MVLNAKGVRKRIIDMAYQCGKSVHIGGSLSTVEILTVLYRDVINYHIDEPEWCDRDRFILSKGHCVLALYAVLAEIGVMSESDISTYMQNGSLFGSHPIMDILHGIECSSGSLGQGISIALGIAKAAKLQNKDYHVYTLVGNGECNEGSVWEALLLAGQWRLDNLTVIIDSNKIQSDGESRLIIDLSNVKERLSGFGLTVLEVDGHNENELNGAFNADTDGKTKVVVCNTVKGKGISFMENNNEWHHNRLIKETYESAVNEIEGIA